MTNVVSCNPAIMPVDLTSMKAKQQAMWASGDFAVIGTTLQIVGESLSEAANVQATDRVLDVAAGNGNATLAAARRFAVSPPRITYRRFSSTDDVGPKQKGSTISRSRWRMPRPCRTGARPSTSCFLRLASCSRRTMSEPRPS